MSVLNVCFLNGLINQSQSEMNHNISIVSFDIPFQFVFNKPFDRYRWEPKNRLKLIFILIWAIEMRGYILA